MGTNNTARAAQHTKSDCRALGVGGRHGGPSVLLSSRKSYKEVIEPPDRLLLGINDRGIKENILKLKQVSCSTNILAVLTTKNHLPIFFFFNFTEY